MIVVVDDEPLVRALIADVLDDLGHAAVEASDGPEGLHALERAAHVDLLITDIGLPNGMDGRQLAAAARVARPKLKILFITGDVHALGGQELEDDIHILGKPFELDALAAKVKELIAA